MTFLKQFITDLRQKRLLPVVAGLLVGIVVVPVLLSRPAKGTQVAGLPQAAPAVAPAGTAVPAVSISSSSLHSRLQGSARDPFTQLLHGSSAGAGLAQSGTTSSSSSSGGSSSSSAAKTSSTSSKGGSTSTPKGSGSTTTSSPTQTSPTTPTTQTTPPTSPEPTFTGLTDTESYHVALAFTDSFGGVQTIDPVQRLSVLPTKQQPLLVELGVLYGGNRVLFAVEPGTVVSGPGTCTPGPIDCEVLSLAPNQVEGLSIQSQSGVVSVGLFAVTALKIDQHSSARAATKARRSASPAGQRLLRRSHLSALSLFQYEPSLGAVVDRRDLKVRGN